MPVCSRLRAEIRLTRDGNATAGEEHMRLSDWRKTRLRLALVYVLAICSFQLYPLVSHAQNLGTQPATGQAVQGQTAAQPEGTVLNLVNWVGNVISPVGAALAVVMAVISYSQGRGVARWAVTAAGLLVISGLTRLIEFWIQNGTAGVQ
jgi:zona occludens toxin (predicted ATPase)